MAGVVGDAARTISAPLAGDFIEKAVAGSSRAEGLVAVGRGDRDDDAGLADLDERRGGLGRIVEERVVAVVGQSGAASAVPLRKAA